MSDEPRDESPIDAQLAAPPGEPFASDQRPVDQGPEKEKDLIQNRLAVLALLFFVTGALGIPLLWLNRRFSNAERYLWSVVVTIYTIALIAAVAAIVWWAYNRVFPSP